VVLDLAGELQFVDIVGRDSFAADEGERVPRNGRVLGRPAASRRRDCGRTRYRTTTPSPTDPSAAGASAAGGCSNRTRCASSRPRNLCGLEDAGDGDTGRGRVVERGRVRPVKPCNWQLWRGSKMNRSVGTHERPVSVEMALTAVGGVRCPKSAAGIPIARERPSVPYRAAQLRLRPVVRADDLVFSRRYAAEAIHHDRTAQACPPAPPAPPCPPVNCRCTRDMMLAIEAPGPEECAYLQTSAVALVLFAASASAGVIYQNDFQTGSTANFNLSFVYRAGT
jgi:hypothetical protein